MVLGVSILKGETSVQRAARPHGLTVAEIEEWQERLLLAADNALRARPKDDEALKDEHIKKVKQKIGEPVARPRHPQGDGDAPPFPGGALGSLREVFPRVSDRRLCRVLGGQSQGRPAGAATRPAGPRRVSVELARQIAALVHQHPTCGYRRFWAVLRFRQGHRSTIKTVYRMLQRNEWCVRAFLSKLEGGMRLAAVGCPPSRRGDGRSPPDPLLQRRAPHQELGYRSP